MGYALMSSKANSESFNILKSKVLKFIRPKPNSFFNCLNPKGIKLIKRLRLGLSHIRDRQFSRLFQPICSCGIQVETTVQDLLHCPNYYLPERKPFWTTSNLSFLIF